MLLPAAMCIMEMGDIWDPRRARVDTDFAQRCYHVRYLT